MNVLVVGVYMGERPNTVAHLVDVFRDSSHRVTQRWVAVGKRDRAASPFTVEVVEAQAKFPLLNAQLAGLEHFDYVLCCDDDVTLPDGFLDEYLEIQAELGFALAQPARSRNSHFWHPITRAQEGLARETRFVEIGPMFSVHRSGFEHVFPFDEVSPWGFGYEFLWAAAFKRAGLRMGVVDATPLVHTLRPHGTTFSYRDAHAGWDSLSAERELLRPDECFVNVTSYPRRRAAA